MRWSKFGNAAKSEAVAIVKQQSPVLCDIFQLGIAEGNAYQLSTSEESRLERVRKDGAPHRTHRRGESKCRFSEFEYDKSTYALDK